MTPPTYRKKLIEVALPLEAINRESARENFIYKGNPSAIHKWWAQRPLAACRAVLFASLVDDPSSKPSEFPTEELQERERSRLFRLIEDLVVWENSTNQSVLEAARREIVRSADGDVPAIYDPFCGGGSIPLEGQRLGLTALASDLNPVPVLITKSLIELPVTHFSVAPVNPESRKALRGVRVWRGARGLSEDIRYYGRWIRERAAEQIGKLYPNARTEDGDIPVLAWLWARTVTCPNPACRVEMPLARSFLLSSKKGREAWVAPVVDRQGSSVTIHFRLQEHRAPDVTSTVGRRGATCVACGQSVSFPYIREEAKAGRMGSRLMAMVVDGKRHRRYLNPDAHHESVALGAAPLWAPSTELPPQALSFRVQAYGMTRHADLFTKRQTSVLSTLGSLIRDAREQVIRDAVDSGYFGSHKQASEYADAVSTYLAFAISKTAEYNCTLVPWYAKEDRPKGVFARHALPMVWDYAEVNPLGTIGGTFMKSCDIIADALPALPTRMTLGTVAQADATADSGEVSKAVVCTDPPYYANIGYADLSDFFYVWLRHALREIHPSLFGTLLTPKAEELIASPFRFGGDRKQADQFFEMGLGKAFRRMHAIQDQRYPMTVFYAFKQAESASDEEGTAQIDDAISSTGWETMLEGLVSAGFVVDGTWPIRTERSSRSITIGTNALASSVVLVCRARSNDAASVTRREFIAELSRELPIALRQLQHGNIAPVDLAQAAIGPGMAVFSRYASVLESDGSPMSVRTALALINQVLSDTLSGDEGDLDSDTRWALTWFDQYGFAEGPFGDAETLAKAKVTSTQGLVEAGILHAARGKTRLLRRDELRPDWDPVADARRTIWEGTHYLIRALEKEGEQSAARLISRLGEDSERARDLAYRLYTTCERRGWSQDAQAYNALVVAWPELTRLAASVTVSTPLDSPQQSLGF